MQAMRINGQNGFEKGRREGVQNPQLRVFNFIFMSWLIGAFNFICLFSFNSLDLLQVVFCEIQG